LWVIFALLDPDPDPQTQLNTDPIRIRIRIHNPDNNIALLQNRSSYYCVTMITAKKESFFFTWSLPTMSCSTDIS
jgi:hypothetical protein